MDRLLEQLTREGLLGATEAEWACAYRDEHQIPLDTALLELDLADEPSVLSALTAGAGLASATPADLLHVDPAAGRRLPLGFAKSFFMCPLRFRGDRLVALVEAPLPDESVQELRDVFHIEVDQRVAPAHWLLLAREAVYGIPAGERAHALEAKLERRRGSEDVAAVLGRWQRPTSLSAALSDVLGFAMARVELACFFVRQGDAVRVLTGAGASQVKALAVPLPEPRATLWAAVAHGGYFLGPLAGVDADLRFYESLGRPMPRCAFVIPAPVGKSSSVLLYCDNGARAIATRWVAELALIVSRMGQLAFARGEPAAPKLRDQATTVVGDAAAVPPPNDAPRSAAPLPPSPPPSRLPEQDAPRDAPEREREPARHDAEPAAPERTDMERAVLAKLSRAAAEEGLRLDVFVDRMLASRTDAQAAPAIAPASLFVGEVKGLFERLAADIPMQLARGMEAAFRDLAPRVGGASVPAHAPGPVAAPAPQRPAAADIEIVQKEGAAREVASYQSKRRKTERVKL